MRSVTDWFGEYGASHANPTNKLLHWICVPLIVLSIMGLLWSIPVPGGFAALSPWLNWATLTATFPPGNDGLREQMNHFVLYRPYPQTGRHAAFRRKWFGELVDRYRGTPTKLVFLRLPRGPVRRRFARVVFL